MDKRTTQPSPAKTVGLLSRNLGRTLMVSGIVAALGSITVGGSGCLSRPVTHQEPTTKTNFASVVRVAAIDKLDLLFAIDNSASMGDKQVILGEAVPDLIGRLFQPFCVDADGNPLLDGNKNPIQSDVGGKCASGKPEFAPVHDMHIGIVSSSLGGRGSDGTCPDNLTNDANPSLNAHANDKGHLLNRGGDDEHAVADAGTGNFLAWLPPVDANKGKPDPGNGVAKLADTQKIEADFTDLVVGVHEHGCGYEAQLESAYRFLVQPDPYDTITVQNDVAQLNGVDGTIIKQRASFLRPDSLVAVVMVTDENESTVDPLSFGGRAWYYERYNPHVRPGTQVCATKPTDPACQSCFLSQVGSDPGCAKSLDDTTDHPNVRMFHMKQRFGYDPQYPIDRYLKGFTQRQVPDRNGEHPKDDKGNVAFNYVGKANCTNPLFATNLPTDPKADLCHLTPGPRTPDLVFFALIGGVPWQLLTDKPTDFSNNNTGTFKAALTAADWGLILGKDPLNYDFTGQDWHMTESITPRPGAKDDDAHTREWDTKNQDLQFACTFPFPDAPTAPGGKKDCTSPKFAGACDCAKGQDGSPLNPDSPLCDTPGGTTQVRGKAYPTIKELALTKALGDQGIVASICPRDVSNKQSQDYGYRPAVRAIVDRLKNALANQCLPQPLTADPAGAVPCLILETLYPPQPQATACDPAKGLKQPDPTVLAKFREAQQEAAGGADAGVDYSQLAVCEVIQLTGAKLVDGSCEKSADPGWCYVTGKAAGTCPQAIKFSPTGNPATGAQVSLQCIEQAAIGGGDGG